MKYLHEQEKWDRFVRDSLGEDAVLIHVSRFSSDCRVYRANDSIFKIRRFTPASIRGRNNSYEDEYLIMQHLSSVAGVPAVRSYKRMGEWEQLEMELLPELYDYDPTFGRPHETFKDFRDIADVMRQINRLGCSHGDLHWSKVGRNVEGGINVFGFDHACKASPWRCSARDIFGFDRYGSRSRFSFLNRLPRVWGKSIGFLRRVIARLAKALIKLLPRTGSSAPSTTGSSSTQGTHILKSPSMQYAMLQADPALKILAEAWSVASPDPYYSLDIEGVHFPGIRPWMLRWERIRKNVDFKGKRLLDLGCNMGLLSIHAKLSGAEFCLGVDDDKDLLLAASLASRGFETDVEFRRLDLEDPSPWEENLQRFDLVSALSVLHWVKDKERVWSFISKHNEVLYEGHESGQEAESNLMRAGFTRIIPLGRSERKRELFYALRR